MHGKVIQFKADIDNFKVKNGTVTVNLEASQTELLPEETKNNANS